MSVIEKTKQAIAVVEKHGFQSIIAIYASKFNHMPASIHLEDVTELTGFDCQVIENENISREVFTMLDDVRVFVVLSIEECVAS